MKVVNIFPLAEKRDFRTGTHAKPSNVRGVQTPYGAFRSIAAARDHLFLKETAFWMDLLDGDKWSKNSEKLVKLAKPILRRPWPWDPGTEIPPTTHKMIPDTNHLSVENVNRKIYYRIIARCKDPAYPEWEMM